MGRPRTCSEERPRGGQQGDEGRPRRPGPPARLRRGRRPTQLQQATGLQLRLFANEEGTEADDETGTGDSVDDGPFPVAGGTAQFVLDWTTTGHTDVPVPVTAEGPGAETLTGQHPNTSVHEVLARTLGIRT